MKKLVVLALFVLPMGLWAQKFGHFNSGEIIQALPEYKTAQEEVQKLQTQFESELKTLQEEYQRKGQAYVAARDSLPEAIRARREQELQEMEKRLNDTYQDNQATLQEESNKRMQNIADKIRKATEEIGEAGGYVYIMDTTSGIPYISKKLSTDITEEIKKKLGI